MTQFDGARDARGARAWRRVGALPLALLVVSVFFGFATPAGASCNVIPGVTSEFRGALGTLNRPFAIPGDVGQQIVITLKPAGCDAASSGFLDVPGTAGGEDDFFVTVLFEPPRGARNAIVLTTEANLASCQSKAAAAGTQLGDGRVRCQSVEAGTLEYRIPNATTLEFRFPDTDPDLEGDDLTFTGPVTIAVTPVSGDLPFALANSRCADRPEMVACIDELYRNDGTCETEATLADPVFGHLTALPPANDYEALCRTSGTSCDGTASELRFTVDAAGNALVPMDWRGVLLRPQGLPLPRLVRGDTTAPAFVEGFSAPVRLPGRSFLSSHAPDGRRLPPLFEPQGDVASSENLRLFGSVDAPVAVMRIARRAPDLSSGNPVFRECSGGPNDGLPCMQPDDCPSGACGATTCYEGGVATPTPCIDDSDCPALTECGPALFDFTGRLFQSVGPVIIPRTQLTALEAESPVPIDGLVETPSLLAFVELESVAADDPSNAGGVQPLDRNGDGDTTDPVVVIRDRSTGEILPIGEGGSAGRAASRVRQPPFSFAALDVEEDIVAFLEPEPLQGDCFEVASCDHNDNGQVFETLLRVFRRNSDCGEGVSCGESLTDGLELAVDAAPLIDGRSLAVSKGLVFFRVREADNALLTTSVMSVDSAGSVPPAPYPEFHAGAPAVSPDGRFVAFGSENRGYVPGDGNNAADIFVHDRDLDADGIYDEPDERKTLRVSVNSDGNEATHFLPFFAPALPRGVSADGRSILFESTATDLVENDNNVTCARVGLGLFNCPDLFVHNRDVNGDGGFDLMGDISTERVNVSSSGVESNETLSTDLSGRNVPVLSSNGRFAAFSSSAFNLVPLDNSGLDVFVRDRDLDNNGILDENGEGKAKTVRVSVTTDGSRFISADHPSISANGRYVVFDALRTGGPSRVYLHDRDKENDGVYDEAGSIATSVVSVDSAGIPADSTSNRPSISADGRFVSFLSDAGNLVAGDTNGMFDAFVHDRDADADGIFDEPGEIATSLVSRASNGEIAEYSFSPSIFTATESATVSPDGRLVAFMANFALNLVDRPSGPAVYVHDRLTGITELVSVSSDGIPLFLSAPPHESISSRGEAFFEGLVEISNLGVQQVLRRGPDYSDPRGADLAGSEDLNDTRDGDLADSFLVALDTRDSAPVPVPLGPASVVSVTDGSAAFLAPESMTGVDRNQDGDRVDAFVYLSEDGGPPRDLSFEATAVKATESIVAGLQPNPGGDVMAVAYRRVPPNTGVIQSLGAAAAFDARGSVVAFTDPSSRELWINDTVTGAPSVPLGLAAEDFILGDRILAFRTPENAVPLNGDGDTVDLVMHVYDLASGQLLNTAQAAIPCRLEACDPRIPYRVSGDTVTFLTLESDQSGPELPTGCRPTAVSGECDLNGDGDAADLLLQTFNAREAAEMASAAATAFGSESAVTILGGAQAGVCNRSREACATDADCCPTGADCETSKCFIPPGGCVRSVVGSSCTVTPEGSVGCALDQFCVPAAFPNGTCHVNEGPCANDSECTAPATCQDGDRNLLQLAVPFTERSDSAQLLTTGAVVPNNRGGAACKSDLGCGADEVCSEAGTCQPNRSDLTIAGAADTDGDGVVDDFDNCPHARNAAQSDVNGNGVGDLCDRSFVDVFFEARPGKGKLINPRSEMIVPVALFGSESFEVSKIEVASLALGPGGAPPERKPGIKLRDVNHDGILDLVAHFRASRAGFAFGDSEACLEGRAGGGIQFRGCDVIRTPPAR